MPKGKGMLGEGAISQALKADVESSDSKKTHQSAGEIERISITIDKDMLRKIDTYVFNQKQSDKSANRSRFITEAITSAVNKL